VTDVGTEERENAMPKENDLEGAQDQGGKHGGQAGMPKSEPRPRTNERDGDVVQQRKPQRPQ
jgi:hypothetical protein